MCSPYLPICGISPPLQVNFLCATFKPSKLLNLFYVPVLAHKEVLNDLLFLHVWWLHTLTRIHNVLVPNNAKRTCKRVPNPQKISYNNHIKSHHTLDLRNHELSLCNKRRRGTLLFSLWETLLKPLNMKR